MGIFLHYFFLTKSSRLAAAILSLQHDEAVTITFDRSLTFFFVCLLVWYIASPSENRSLVVWRFPSSVCLLASLSENRSHVVRWFPLPVCLLASLSQNRSHFVWGFPSSCLLFSLSISVKIAHTSFDVFLRLHFPSSVCLLMSLSENCSTSCLPVNGLSVKITHTYVCLLVSLSENRSHVCLLVSVSQ